MKGNEIYDLFHKYSYFGIFIWFAIFQIIFPIPEEIALISIGYLSTHVKISPFLAVPIAILGLVVSDSTFFFLSKTGSKYAMKLTGTFGRNWKDKIQKGIDNHSYKPIFILFFIPQIRIIAPLICGSAGLVYKKFLFINISANIIIVSFYYFIGAFFYNALKSLKDKLPHLNHFVFIALMLILIVVVLIVRKRFKNSEE